MEGLKTKFDEGLGHGSDLLIVLLVGGGFPLTSSLHTKGISVGIPVENRDQSAMSNKTSMYPK